MFGRHDPRSDETGAQAVVSVQADGVRGVRSEVIMGLKIAAIVIEAALMVWEAITMAKYLSSY